MLYGAREIEKHLNTEHLEQQYTLKCIDQPSKSVNNLFPYYIDYLQGENYLARNSR